MGPNGAETYQMFCFLVFRPVLPNLSDVMLLFPNIFGNSLIFPKKAEKGTFLADSP